MSLTEVSIHNLRNIEQAKFNLSPELNLFYGENGSGKTSILEAVYLLSTGKSFRTSAHKNLIRDGEQAATVFGVIRSLQESGINKTSSLGVSKAVSSSDYRINGTPIKHRSELARLLPLLVVTPTSHQLLDAGPHWRRRYLDWGVFHVEHNFGQNWAMFKRGLQQRNSLLNKGIRTRHEREMLRSIDLELGRLGGIIEEARDSYFSQLEPWLEKMIASLLDFEDLEFQLRQGTPQGLCFEDYLKQGVEQDMRRGRTVYGPHTADIKIRIGKYDAKELLSRGQQKLLVYALLLAQIAMFRSETGKQTILALDDVSSELDNHRLQQLLSLLREQFSQLLITSVKKDDLELDQFSECSLFHVKQGTVSLI